MIKGEHLHAVLDEFITLLSSGSTIEEACSKVGVSRQTYYNWISRGESGIAPFASFRDQIEALRAERRLNTKGSASHLTDTQEKMLRFIRDFLSENKYSPTLEEIGEAISGSQTVVLDNIDQMQRNGFVSRARGITRSIRPTCMQVVRNLRTVQGLSEKQNKILDFIWRFWIENGYSPAYQDLLETDKITLTSNVRYHLLKMREKGHINYEDNVGRTIRPTDMQITFLGNGVTA